MPKKIVIEEARISEAIEAVANKKQSYKEAAKTLGIDAATLKYKAKKAGIELPTLRNKLPLYIRLLDRYTRKELMEKSQYELAREFDCTQPNVNAAFKRLKLKGTHWTKRTKEANNALADIVLEHIQEHGGYVTKVIEELGVKIYKGYVYARAEELGIDLSEYRFAYREYGMWTTLPGKVERYQASDYKIQARCNGCGDVYTVQLVNLKTGASQGCRQCAAEGLTFKKVKCIESGKIYRSIRSWAKAIGKERSYQSLRLKLNRTGTYKHEDLNYILID